MSNKKQILSVATAHLDTIWNWDFERTVSRYIKNTLTDNFRLFEQYPDYNFSFEGSFRYELMAEYYPELFEKLKEYVKAGRWFVCGSAFENGDVNVPSPEALFRNILIGNEYFDKTFSKRSKDIYLPDCFGFGYALPAIICHANLWGFTTQKLSWGCAYGNPFDIGRWVGVNGDWCYTVLRPGSYFYSYTKNKYIREWDFLKKKLADAEKVGLDYTMSFHGVGDRGGSAEKKSVVLMEKEMALNSESDVEIVPVAADEVYHRLHKLTPEQYSKLPVWNTELVMKDHGAGGYTSRAIGKRFNRRNEELADAAERASVIASQLGVMNYPQDALTKSWKRVIAHHFHDDMPGTSVERAYLRSWNDLSVSLNTFTNIYQGASDAIIRMLNTNVKGEAVVVNNPAEFDRTEVAVAKVKSNSMKYVKVYCNGTEVPSQVIEENGGELKIAFKASLRPLSYKVFDVVTTDEKPAVSATLSVTENTLENEKYKVTLNSNGDIASVFDKILAKELLSAPVKYDIYEYPGSKEWPAWELQYDQIKVEPQYTAKLVSCEIVENGNARVAIKVTQKCDESTFCFIVSLADGGETVNVFNEIEWRNRHRLVKSAFHLATENENALFDLGLGAISRKNSDEKLYEFPAQKWADITDNSNSFGVSVLSDSKVGWDKPDNHTIRLTAVHTPQENYHSDSMQSMMDLGLNRYSYAICSHNGECSMLTQKQAKMFNLPLVSFVCDKHDGVLGYDYSFGNVSDENVIVRAIKKAENTDEIIVRVCEGNNKEVHGATLTLSDGIESAREVYSSEEEKGTASVSDGKLVFDMKPYEVRSFAVRVQSNVSGSRVKQTTIPVEYNCDVVTSNINRSDGMLPKVNYSLPAELFPNTITDGGIDFVFGDKQDGEKNAYLCDGKKITLPDGAKKLYIIAASLDGDRDFGFTLDNGIKVVSVAAINEKVGGWDMYDMGITAFTKTDRVAFEFTHAHNTDGDIYAKQSYLFRYEIDLDGSKTVTLPNDRNLLIFAASISFEENKAVITELPYDVIKGRKFDFKLKGKEKLNYNHYKFTSFFKKLSDDLGCMRNRLEVYR